MELTRAPYAERRHVLPVKESSSGGGTARCQLPNSWIRRGGLREGRWGRTIVRSRGDHGGCCRFVHGDTGRLLRTGGNRRQRAGQRSVQGGSAGGEVVLERRMGRGDRCGLSRCVWRSDN